MRHSEGYRRKWFWPILRFYLPGGTEEIQKIFLDTCIRAKIITQDHEKEATETVKESVWKYCGEN
jgi:hypothetical protein